MKITNTSGHPSNASEDNPPIANKAPAGRRRQGSAPDEMLRGLSLAGGMQKAPVSKGDARTGNTTESDRKRRRNIQDLASYVYSDSRFYQGTGTKEVVHRRKNGMDPKEKTTTSLTAAADLLKRSHGASAQKMEEVERAALSHFYFTQTKTYSRGTDLGATDYAVMAASADNPPALLRTFLTDEARDQLKVRPDPESMAGLRTDQMVPAGYVLPSKSAPLAVTPASEAFRKQFNHDTKNRLRLKVDTVLDASQAAQLLREEQTPSPTDTFPELPGIYRQIDFRVEAPTKEGDGNSSSVKR